MSDSEDFPSDIEEATTSAVSTLLPSKFKGKYEKMYNRFTSWCENKDLKNHLQEKALLAYFSQRATGYKSKKSITFTKEEIARFLKEADDKKFLLTKVGLVIGIARACRKQELTNLLNEKVKDEGSVFHIEITYYPVGINTFGNMPKNIASFLNLPYPEQYTGHCFLCSGADLLTVKRHGG
ncbi:hypothetical protein NQ315_012805 [Exocentrus adspersus]|uniref:Uncharacterized protein n=1 Tax=Exocentrus adspersus TaxID=1586481 RepID=A0AAV8VBK5_9CUCU|nr:hypothetical protein NQ315_012805 [Exocentrus adspersus]